MIEYREEISKELKKNNAVFFHNNSSVPKKLAGLHWHESYEILYIRRGWGKQRINAEVFSVHPGDFVIIRPGDLHSTDAQSESGCDVDVVQFFDSFLQNEENVLSALTSGIIRTNDSRIPHLLDVPDKYGEEKTASEKLILSGLVRMIIGVLVNARQSEAVPQKTSAIEAVCVYLEQAEDLCLSAVAEHFGYSCEHLSRKFHKETGISFRLRCEQIRMQRAVNLLTDKSYSLSEIADILHYCDKSSFIRAFKRIYGITPSAFRKRKV